MKKTKKKAFTLTELLVVVIVIGVLAAVTLPSFNKVLETRKTTEAEDVLSALRTEQEYRCAMEKPYAADLNQLDTLASNTKKNFDYKISTEGSGSSAKVTGSEAVSKGKYNYTLRMPSYADGRMCCEGTDCGKLNKDYPLCSVLKARADYKQVPANCAPDADGLGDSGDVPHGDKCGEMPADLVKYQQCQAVGGVGMCGREVKKPVCDQSTDYKWKEGNEWDKSACTKADADEVKPKSCAAGTCGTITTTATCNATGEKNWAWTYTSDEATACTTKSDETETCSDGTVRTRKYTCENDKWVLGDWDKECPEEENYTCKSAKNSGKFSCKGDFVYDSTKGSKKLQHYDDGYEHIEENYIEYQDYYESYCCTCPSGKVWKSGSTCGTCEEVRGKNYTNIGGQCVPRFKATATSRHVSFGDRSGVYHMANTEWCFQCNHSFINAPKQIQPCSIYGSPQQMCDQQCDQNQSTCMAACYTGSPSFTGDGYEYGYSSGGSSTASCSSCCCQSGCCGFGGGQMCNGHFDNWACSGGGSGTTQSFGSCSGGCTGVAQARASHTETPSTYYTDPSGRKVSEVSCTTATQGYKQCSFGSSVTVTACYVPQVSYVSGYTCGSMTAKGQCSGGYGYY